MLEEINRDYDRGQSGSCRAFYATLNNDLLYKSCLKLVSQDDGMRLDPPRSFLVASALRKWLGGARQHLSDLSNYVPF